MVYIVDCVQLHEQLDSEVRAGKAHPLGGSHAIELSMCRGIDAEIDMRHPRMACESKHDHHGMTNELNG